MKTALIAAALIAAGCTTLQPAPSQTYRPKGAADQVQVRGEVDVEERLLLYPGITARVFVGEQKVIEGPLAQWGDGELHGTWNGKAVDALCNGKHSPHRIACLVLIDNERAANLSF